MKETSEWQTKLKRAIVRRHIGDVLDSGLSLRNTINRSKDFKNSQKLAVLLEELVNSELILNPKLVPLVEEIQRDLEKEFPSFKGLFIILFGSGAHGGGKVRTLSNNYQDSDLDWGLAHSGIDLGNTRRFLKAFVPYRKNVTNDELSIKKQKTLKRIEEFVSAKIKEKRDKFGLSEHFQSCGYYNGLNFNFEMKTSIKGWIDELIKLSKMDRPALELILAAFQPSFPAEFNERNRELILQALSDLYAKDQHLWDKCIRIIIKEWKNHHTLKKKHIISSYYMTDKPENVRTSSLADNVAVDSVNHMIQPMERLLRSTAKIDQ